MKKMVTLLLLFFCILLCGSAFGDTAPNLTSQCDFRAGSARSSFRKATDRDYKTYWTSGGDSLAEVVVTLPKDKTASGVAIKWYEHTHAWCVQVKDENGDWVTCGQTDGLYYSEYLSLPEGTTKFRIANAEGTTTRMKIAELYVYGEGDLPPEVQQWTPPAEKADLLLIVAHPDDEVLWFGGVLPVYAGEYKMAVQVCMMVPTVPNRRLELLDCLWTCGVRNYPVWGNFPDKFASTLQKMYTLWKKNTVYKTVVGWIRRFKPEVLLSHDVYGEYGHGAHRVLADACIHTLSMAADPEKYPDSAKEYGTWDVPKTYLHLYKENVLDLDWRRPLSAFGGKTGFDVACEAFECHVSQQKTDYHVEDWGDYDNSLFGLVRSLVGEDVNKTDFFENLSCAPGSKILEETIEEEFVFN